MVFCDSKKRANSSKVKGVGISCTWTGSLTRRREGRAVKPATARLYIGGRPLGSCQRELKALMLCGETDYPPVVSRALVSAKLTRNGSERKEQEVPYNRPITYDQRNHHALHRIHQGIRNTTRLSVRLLHLLRHLPPRRGPRVIARCRPRTRTHVLDHRPY